MVENLLGEASGEFAVMPCDPDKEANAPTVFLCGDVFLRVDDRGSDDLARKLNNLCLRVMLEPYGELGEFLALYRSAELVELETSRLKNRFMRYAMDYATTRLVEVVRQKHPWVKWDNAVKVERESRELLERWPLVESIPAMGSALFVAREERGRHSGGRAVGVRALPDHGSAVEKKDRAARAVRLQRRRTRRRGPARRVRLAS